MLNVTVYQETYTYDPVGNRQSSMGASPYTYNASNQLSSRPGVTYVYDNNGNQTSKTNTYGTFSNVWDFENRLTSATISASQGSATFKYDPLGRRIQKVRNTGTTVYVYDGTNIIEETDANGVAVARYAQGLGIDEPLAMLRSGTKYYYEADGLGSITSLTNNGGTIVKTYTYDSFGRNLGQTGSVTNPFQFTGREWDLGPDYYYYRARYYDPQTGRFISEDPIEFTGNSVNFYEYGYDNPTDFTDPFGLQGLNPVAPSSPVMPPPPPPVALPPVPPVAAPAVGTGAATSSGVSAGTGAIVAATVVLAALDVGLAIYDGYQLYRLGLASGWWGPTSRPTPQPGPFVAPKQNCKDDKDCEKEWADAREMCRRYLELPHPPRSITGGYKDIENCARGLVSEACGGNRVDRGKR